MPEARLTVEAAVAAFGISAKNKLGAVAAAGEPEDQLRSPLEQLFSDMVELCGHARSKLVLVGESSLAELHTRPDYAVSFSNALIGFIEVKAPGKGADPRKFKDRHDKEQWKKLSALPNLVYTDGNGFSLWRDGVLLGRVEQLDGDIETSGARLKPPAGFISMFSDFFSWTPIPPTSPRQLANTSARLCRLLRDEVSEQVKRKDLALTGLASDWRHMLFPNASNEEFADGYAQAVTFGLLLARAQGISLKEGIGNAAKILSASNSLIGTALRLLTDDVMRADVLPTSVATLGRVLAVVDWPKISKGNSDAWLYFYEEFLAVYDNTLRKKTGSYYTPVEVVKPMTRLVNEALHDRFGFTDGLANSSVTLVDPAMGTGTFLLEALRSLAAIVAEDEGQGAVPSAVDAALSKLIGFELQLGPFAVAQLRILAEVNELGDTSTGADALRTYVTNTLDNPYIEDETLGTFYEPIAKSRREANKIKKDEPVMVVLGNPPYKEKSHGKGGWIEKGTPEAGYSAPLADFIPPTSWGLGVHVKHLYNPYIYFWRWATWKVFDHHPKADRGIVCFITVAGFLDGPGFQQMREYLRRRCNSIWIIDCSPEGYQPPVPTRIFQAVQQPVCIVLAVRDRSTVNDTPAEARFRRLAKGSREEKFNQLDRISLDLTGWDSCPSEWRSPFLAAGGAQWLSNPPLEDLLRWSGSGIMPGRTWVIAPDKPNLKKRWKELIEAPEDKKSGLLAEHKTDRRVNTVLSDGLPGFPPRKISIGEETGPCPEPVLIGYRSFDRQWIIPDKRLINRPNPTLWSIRSSRQVYLTAPHTTTPTSGPAVTFTAEIPDIDHYKGSFGGRAFPLWLDPDGQVSNIIPGLTAFLAEAYGVAVSDEDLFAYLAGMLANPRYTSMFAEDLSTPGIRVPLTAEAEIFSQVAAVGKRVVWLHSYGERFNDPASGRPKQPPRLPEGQAPKVLAEYPIPSSPEQMPDALTYDAVRSELHVGTGRISHVTTAMRDYEVSRVNVLNKWFSYRRLNRERPQIGERHISPLQQTQSDKWLAGYTTELINLLNVLGLLVELEPQQAELLEAIVSSPLITVDDLTSADILPVPPELRKAPKTLPPKEDGMLI